MPFRRMHHTIVEASSGGEWLVEDADGVVTRVPAGRVFVMPADCLHRLEWTGPDGTTEWWWISLDDVVEREALRELRHPWILSPEASRSVLRALRSGRSPLGTLQGRIHEQLRALEVIHHVLADRPEIPSRTAPIDPRIDRVLAHIESHRSARLSRSELARVAHLSPTRFHDVFKTDMRMPPQRYVLERRLEWAREMLASTNDPVKLVGAACGFPDPARFSRKFRAWVHVTPTQYRAQFR